MDDIFKDCLWKNFGAEIDMLKDVITICPDRLWQEEKKFFYLAYHTVIFLDYYLTIPVKDFQPGLPYTIIQEDKLPFDAVDDVIPNMFYSKNEFIIYLSSIREKCKNLVTLSSEQKLKERWISDDEINMHGLCPGIAENYSLLEILFYNFRHVQHHVAQLNFILRQKANMATGWVSHAD
jgi:hypothetical protein